MSIDFLISVLDSMEKPTKINRNNVANIVLEQPKLITNLVNLTFDTDNKLSIKAAWILEWLCTHHGINNIHQCLDIFTEKISEVHFHSAIRPCAKICEHIAIAYTSKEENDTKFYLKENHINTIVETGFDWLITDQKIAVRAYSMTTLYLFGLHKRWIHPELKHLISSKIIHESKGCKARGTKILKLINKHS